MRTSSQEAGLIGTIILTIVALSVCFGGIYWLMSTKCKNQWVRSGLKSEYALLQGCMVERKDGTWWPADRMRDVTEVAPAAPAPAKEK